MRHAIYWVPAAQTQLYRFGASVIGYDAYTGAEVAPPPHHLFAESLWGSIAAEPRRYGFHATLKAPFELAPGSTESGLMAATAELADAWAPLPAGRFALSEAGAFLSLRPSEENASGINALAFGCVRALEPFRAPLADADRQRRLAATLSARQIESLDRWGYPHVGPDFKFHMTLTGRLDGDVRARVAPVLAALYAGIEAPVVVEALAVCRQVARDRPFTVVSRFPLRGPA